MIIDRFSQLYIQEPVALNDSPRMRKRISSFYENEIHDRNFSSSKSFGSVIAGMIERELGISVPSTYAYAVYYEVPKLLESCELRDFLDCISIINTILKSRISTASTNWIEFIERVFREERTTYSIDDNGVVHPYVDAEFTKNHQATLDLLSNPRYEQIRTIYENAYSSLRSDKQNTRTAIKDIFECLETLAKLLDDKIKVLGDSEVNNRIKPICENLIQDEDERNFVKLMISSMADWVNAHHIYRHGQSKEKHTPPTLESAIFSLSMGSSYLRFMLQIDQKLISESQ